MARKNVAPKGGYSRKIRKPKEEGEIFARVTSIYGGGHAGILCADGIERTLVIRGRFRGRNKRDNTIRLNTFVLAGLRSVSMGSTTQGNKKEKADLLFVYSENQINELKTLTDIQKILTQEEIEEQNKNDIGFEFTNKIIEEDDELENKIISIKNNNNELLFKDKEEEISWDDI